MSKKSTIKKFSQSENKSDVFESNSNYTNDYIYQQSKELKIGEALQFRFITLDSDFCPETKQVACSVLNPNTRKLMAKVPVPQPEWEDDDQDILDDADQSLRELMDTKSCYRSVKKMPVWLIAKLGEDRSVSEEINRLGYLEVNYALLKSFKKMKENVDEDHGFDEGLPPYSVLLVKDEGSMEGMPQYDFKPCKKIREGKSLKDEATYGEADLEEALGAEVWKKITEEIDDMIQFLFDLREEETTVSAVRNKFVRYRNNNGSSKSSNVDVEDIDEAVEEIEEAEESEEEEKPKRSAVAKTGKKWAR